MSRRHARWWWWWCSREGSGLAGQQRRCCALTPALPAALLLPRTPGRPSVACVAHVAHAQSWRVSTDSQPGSLPLSRPRFRVGSRAPEQ